MGKLPWRQFYPGDWMNDPSLSLCEPSTRGIWIDALCTMFLADTYKVSGTPRQLARLLRCSEPELHVALEDLKNTDSARVMICNETVTVVCKRLEREHKERESNRLRVEKHRKEKAGNGDVTPKSLLTYDSISSGVVSGGSPEGGQNPPDDHTPPTPVTPWTREQFNAAAKYLSIPDAEANQCWAYYDSQCWRKANGQAIGGDPRSLLTSWTTNPKRLEQAATKPNEAPQRKLKLVRWED